uniref:Uncharacterized protein n=1 Tax=Siphoviridae sp. ct6oU4 TaxID=2826299 RepID=A0A8S5QPI5_9CAUD|nr:MAG TPA: hypothetical protein [Siphoviridae sp. ct6oU4]
MFCRDKEATAVVSALHSYDYHPALREDRGFSLIPKTCILIFGSFAKGRCPRGSYSPFLQTYRHSFHSFFKV